MINKKVEIVWIILIFFTIFAYLLGKLELINTLLVGVLLFTTFIKGQLVIDYFMGLKNVSYKYRFIPISWLALILSLVAVAYY